MRIHPACPALKKVCEFVLLLGLVGFLFGSPAAAQDINHQRDPLSVTRAKIHRSIQQLIHLDFENYSERDQFFNDFFPDRTKVFGDEFGNGRFSTPNHPLHYVRVEVDWLKVELMLDYQEASRRSEPLFDAEQQLQAEGR